MGRRLDKEVHNQYKEILEAAQKMSAKKKSVVFKYPSGGSRRAAVDQNWSNLTVAALLERDGFAVTLKPDMEELVKEDFVDWDKVELSITVRRS